MEQNSKRKRTRVQPINKKVASVRFVVSSKGYNETFDSVEKARGQYDILKKRAIKNKESVKIQIHEKNENNKKVIDEVSISEDYYD